MPNYLDLSDEGAARAAARRISSVGGRLQTSSIPPTVKWGDDEFGEAMREAYYLPTDEGVSVPTAALMARETIGDALVELGQNVEAAIDEITGEEGQNVGEIDGVHPPNV